MTPSFSASSTADDILRSVDVRGKRVLVTGVTVGSLGFEIARSLAAYGADVIGTARDEGKAAAIGSALRSSVGDGAVVRIVSLDLASLASVRSCAASLVTGGEPLDIVIANAGVMAGPLRRTAEGFEMQFGVNYLGHFALVDGVRDILRPGGRVVCVSSAGHRRSDVDLDDLNFETTPYEELLAYGRSKTALVLFAVEFDRRYRSENIRATAVHPGAVLTETVERMIRERLAAGNDVRSAYAWKSVAQGAASPLWAAVAAPSDDVGGRYCEDCRVASVDDDPRSTAGVRSYSLDVDRAKALWSISEALVRPNVVSRRSR